MAGYPITANAIGSAFKPFFLHHRAMNAIARRLIRGLRLLFWLLPALYLLFLLILLIFRWVPLPTSAFIYQQNALHAAEPKVYKPANYEWLDWEDMPKQVALAVITAEDQRFPDHWGVDLIELSRSFRDVKSGKARSLRGASTITQQVAKNLFLWNGRSYVRKGVEVLLSLSLELVWSKERILEVYLNVAQFADVTFGVQAASKVRFDKEAGELTLEESAMLAAVLPTPARSTPNDPSASLQKRHAWILDHMKKLGGLKYLERL